jgi:hypothetical protein
VWCACSQILNKKEVRVSSLTGEGFPEFFELLTKFANSLSDPLAGEVGETGFVDALEIEMTRRSAFLLQGNLPPVDTVDAIRKWVGTAPSLQGFPLGNLELAIQRLGARGRVFLQDKNVIMDVDWFSLMLRSVISKRLMPPASALVHSGRLVHDDAELALIWPMFNPDLRSKMPQLLVDLEIAAPSLCDKFSIVPGLMYTTDAESRTRFFAEMSTPSAKCDVGFVLNLGHAIQLWSLLLVKCPVGMLQHWTDDDAVLYYADADADPDPKATKATTYAILELDSGMCQLTGRFFGPSAQSLRGWIFHAIVKLLANMYPKGHSDKVVWVNLLCPLCGHETLFHGRSIPMSVHDFSAQVPCSFADCSATLPVSDLGFMKIATMF